MVGKVLLATKCTSVADQLNGHLRICNAENRGDRVTVVPDTLATGIHVEPQISVLVEGRDGQRRLRFKERLLDALCLEDFANDVCALGERSVDVAPMIFGRRQDVPFEAPHCMFDTRQRRDGIGERREWRAIDRHEVCCPTGDLSVFRDDDCEDIAEVARAATDGNHERPILVDQSGSEGAGNVGGGEDTHNAADLTCGRRVDAVNVGSCVLRKDQRAVQHSLGIHVVYIRALTNCQLGTFVFDSRAADAATRHDHGRLARRECFDRVENLHVAGAATEVRPEMTGRFFALQRRTLLVDQGHGANDNSRRTKPALQRAARGEGLRISANLVRRHSLKRRDAASGGLGKRQGAGHLSLAVDHHRAAAALTLRRAAVFRRSHLQFLAQGSEKMWVAPRDRYRRSVYGQGNAIDVEFVGHGSALRAVLGGSEIGFGGRL